MVFCNTNNVTYDVEYNGHNPYFNRWFSAIDDLNLQKLFETGHNPYFNRWFSAINLFL